MRLLKLGSQDELSLTKDLSDDAPRYAILSHTWNENNDEEVTFSDIENKSSSNKVGYANFSFVANKLRKTAWSISGWTHAAHSDVTCTDNSLHES
jgi:precorrin-4 methylase